MIVARSLVIVCCMFAFGNACKKSERGAFSTANDYWAAQKGVNDALLRVIAADDAKDCDQIAANMSGFYDVRRPTNGEFVAFEKSHPDVWVQAKADDLQDQLKAALAPCLTNKAVMQALTRSPFLPTPSWAVEQTPPAR